VIWTAPLTTLLNLLHLDPSPIRYLSTIIFNIELAGDPAIKYQWCYFGQQDTTINRISIPVLFSPLAAPRSGTGICVEITCFEGDNSWNNPESLVQEVINDLIKVKVIKRKEDIQKIHIEKIPNTYPVYDTEYLSNLDSVLEQVGRFNKLKLLGRTGTFWYNNMDHSISMTFTMVKDILQAGRTA
jgi:protoporphyrinogen oxidase